MDTESVLLNQWKNYARSFLPEGATLASEYYIFGFRVPVFEATLYYRIDGGPKRRIDLEWSLTNQGDVLGNEPVPFEASILARK